MAVKFKAGTKVRQIMPAPVEGEVIRYVFDETSGDIHCIVVDLEGQESTWLETEVEAVK